MCKVEEDSEKGIEGEVYCDVGMNYLGEQKLQSTKFFMVSNARMKLWTLRAITTLLLWTCIIQLVAIGEVWGPRLLKSWPSCSSAPIMYKATNLSSFQTRNHFPQKSESFASDLSDLVFILVQLLANLLYFLVRIGEHLCRF